MVYQDFSSHLHYKKNHKFEFSLYGKTHILATKDAVHTMFSFHSSVSLSINLLKQNIFIINLKLSTCTNTNNFHSSCSVKEKNHEYKTIHIILILKKTNFNYHFCSTNIMNGNYFPEKTDTEQKQTLPALDKRPWNEGLYLYIFVFI